MRHPAPTEHGTCWAVLRDPHEQPEGESWVSGEWEAVRVVDRSYTGYDVSLMVFVPGIAQEQPLYAFEWGPRIPDYAPGRVAPRRLAAEERHLDPRA